MDAAVISVLRRLPRNKKTTGAVKQAAMIPSFWTPSIEARGATDRKVL